MAFCRFCRSCPGACKGVKREADHGALTVTRSFGLLHGAPLIAQRSLACYACDRVPISHPRRVHALCWGYLRSSVIQA